MTGNERPTGQKSRSIHDRKDINTERLHCVNHLLSDVDEGRGPLCLTLYLGSFILDAIDER